MTSLPCGGENEEKSCPRIGTVTVSISINLPLEGFKDIFDQFILQTLLFFVIEISQMTNSCGIYLVN